MTQWSTYWDRPALTARTPLTVRGDHVYGHITGSGPVHGRPVRLHRFLSAGLRNTTNSGPVPTGILTAAGRPAAQVTAWIDKHGIACAGRLLVPPSITASARISGSDPWPRWEIIGDAAHLVAVELDRSRSASPTYVELTGPERQAAALARINAVRQERALRRITKART